MKIKVEMRMTEIMNYTPCLNFSIDRSKGKKYTFLSIGTTHFSFTMITEKELRMVSRCAFVIAFLFLLSVSAYSVQVSVPELSAEPGAKVTATIDVDDATGVAGGDITLEYDPAVLAIKDPEKDVRATDLMKGFFWDKNTNTVGKVRIVMASAKGLEKGSGAMFEIDFEIKASAKGESPLTLTKVTLFDEQGNSITVTIKNGSVTIKEKPVCTTPAIREHKPGSKILALQAEYNAPNVHGHVYIDIWKGSVPVEVGQFLEFQVVMFSGNPTFKCSVDLHTTDGGNLRDSQATDQNGVSAHPSADLSKYARDTWYHRKISLDALAGKTIDGVMIATDSDEHRAGLFRGYVDNIQITKDDCIVMAIYLDEDTIPITGKSVAEGTTFAGTSGMRDYSVSIVGETPVTPTRRLTTLWGSIKSTK